MVYFISELVLKGGFPAGTTQADERTPFLKNRPLYFGCLSCRSSATFSCTTNCHRQIKQEIGKGEERERSVRRIGAFVELIPR